MCPGQAGAQQGALLENFARRRSRTSCLVVRRAQQIEIEDGAPGIIQPLDEDRFDDLTPMHDLEFTCISLHLKHNRLIRQMFADIVRPVIHLHRSIGLHTASVMPPIERLRPGRLVAQELSQLRSFGDPGLLHERFTSVACLCL